MNEQNSKRKHQRSSGFATHIDNLDWSFTPLGPRVAWPPKGCQAIADQAAEEARPRAKRIVTDKLRSYGAAKRDVMPAIEHRSHKGLNNRAENSHLPLRKRERVMQGFRSVGSLQQFVPVFSAVRNHFVPSHQKHSALATHIHRIRAMAHWKAVTGATA